MTVCADNLGGGQFSRRSGIRVEAQQVNEAAEARLDLAAYRQQALAEDGDVTLQPHFEPRLEIERGWGDLA